MAESRHRREHVIHTHGGSPEEVANHLVQSLLELLRAASEGRDSAAVVPVQASGATLDEMLEGLVRDLLDIVDASPTRIVDAELSHVMKTGDGFRAWGYVWFGQTESTARALSLETGLDLSTLANGELDVRATLLESDRSPGSGSDAMEAPRRR